MIDGRDCEFALVEDFGDGYVDIHCDFKLPLWALPSHAYNKEHCEHLIGDKRMRDHICPCYKLKVKEKPIRIFKGV